MAALFYTCTLVFINQCRLINNVSLIWKDHRNILTAVHNQDGSINLQSKSRQSRLLLHSFNIINYNIKVFIFEELSLPTHYISRCWTPQFVRCLLPAKVRIWNYLPFLPSVLPILCLTLERWTGLGRSQPLVAPLCSVSSCFRSVSSCFCSVSSQVLAGLRMQFLYDFVFFTWVCAAGINYNNIDNNNSPISQCIHLISAIPAWRYSSEHSY